jgi:N6-adenosine-specific RNA methylase IME4
MSDWPFGTLKPFSYDLIMVDPPWPTTLRSPKGEGKSFTRHYGAMSFEQIAALPVGQLASKNCVLMLWATWGLLLHGGDPKRHFAGADAGRSPVGETMQGWGFRYVTGGPWLKRTVTGKLAFGCGYRLRDCNEPFLLGVTGAPVTSRRERNLIEGLRREHSRKPEEAFAWCERLMPDARKLELFSRQSRPGWDSWGLEAGKFDPVVQVAA